MQPPPARILRLGLEYLLYYLALLCFSAAGLVVTCVSAVLYPLLPRSAGMRVGRSAIWLVFRTFLAMVQSTGLVRLDLRALDALKGEPGLVIAPNHPSLLDAALVISRLPQAGCIVKHSIWGNPILGGGARLSRYIRNDSPRAMVRAATIDLRAGQALLVFPEGTRTRCAPVNAFRGGFALVAKRAHAPIQTVFIEANSGFLSKDWPLWKKPAFPLEYRVRLGRRFEATGSVHTLVAQLERYYVEELSGRTHAESDALAAESVADLDSRERSHA
jgi:1-acyl-sn-glycerol-3-phosphate acyltransferase